jgi:predicted membrane channel-forming protein YqfA (hemolysin III family)
MSLPSGISHVDRLGAGVSFLCAIHCAILPFAATILPLLGFGFLADARLERMIVIVSIALATMSVCWGIRLHRQRRILIVFGAALSLILMGRNFAEGIAEILLVVPGGLLFVCGHLINQRLSRQCRTCRHS